MTVLDAILTGGLVLGLAARVGRLVTVDDVAQPFRDLIVTVAYRVGGSRAEAAAMVGVHCPFCIGFWTSAAVVGSYYAVGHTLGWRIVAAVATVSYLQGHTNRILDTPGGPGDDDG